MKKYISFSLIFNSILVLVFIFSGCNKQDEFLNKKPNAALAVPTSLSDFELLLNNEEIFNAYDSPALGTLSSDDLYVSDATFISSETVAQNVYTFAKDIYQSSNVNGDWNAPYQQVYYCNVVLDGLAKKDVSPDQLSRYNTIKGEALFFRAYAFYNLVQTFSMPYDSQTSGTDMGIPLPISSDINIRYGRGTVQETYDKIISDINAAAALLPANLSAVTKPCKLSCNAFLARVYLAVAKYDMAYTYADKCLSQKNNLVDYNTFTPNRSSLSSTPLAEDIFHTSLNGYSMTAGAQMDSVIYKSYDSNDLRKTYFFRPTRSGIGLYFRGTYDFTNNYSGIATDEIYLIRAESSARLGNVSSALADLNSLLKNRYKAGTFIPVTTTDPDILLKKILLEREKELFLRGLRWTDLRRLNKENRFKKNVVHVINGVTYTLSPNDPKYAMPIPAQEIQLTGIPQNIR